MNKNNQSLGGEVAVKRSGAKKFNFIDVLIILAIILLVAIVASIIAPTSLFGAFSTNSTETIQYTVEFSGVDMAFVNNIADNDNVVDAVSKFSLGSVAAIDNNSNYRALQYNESTGTGSFAVYKDKYDLLVTITVDAEYKEGEGYFVNDRRIAVGEKLSLRFPNYIGEGYCVGISKAD